MTNTSVHVSVVSHGHGKWIPALLSDLARWGTETPLTVTLTLNIPEPLGVDVSALPVAVRIVRNGRPRGFGANHNAALLNEDAGFFCVLNPDVRLRQNPFPALLGVLDRHPRCGVVAPRVVGAGGGVEVSARLFPTPQDIALKAASKIFNGTRRDQLIAKPDWLAGMFMLFPANVFREVAGFDERFFLYYEDVDLCARLALAGYAIQYEPRVSIEHSAQHSSHRNLKYLRWHMASLLRFWRTHGFFRASR